MTVTVTHVYKGLTIWRQIIDIRMSVFAYDVPITMVMCHGVDIRDIELW